jgi:aryl-alcohol dehydrogenase-like predicted oxidoreductase
MMAVAISTETSMQYALLGGTGLLVSRLAFGAMTFTAGNHDIGAVYQVGAELADEMVGRALDRGVTFFDTADGYAGGESEALLGRALRHRRDSVVIATKVGFRTGAPLTQAGLSRRHITWSVEQSLTRLGTDWIDVYLTHREDPYTPLEETLSAFDAVVASGKVRYIGFSNWSAWKVAAALEIQKANGLAPFTHGQMHYSLLGRDVERDVVPMMQRYGLGMTVWSPLASGFLSASTPGRRCPNRATATPGSTSCHSTRNTGSASSTGYAPSRAGTTRAWRRPRWRGCWAARA